MGDCDERPRKPPTQVLICKKPFSGSGHCNCHLRWALEVNWEGSGFCITCLFGAVTEKIWWSCRPTVSGVVWLVNNGCVWNQLLLALYWLNLEVKNARLPSEPGSRQVAHQHASKWQPQSSTNNSKRLTTENPFLQMCFLWKLSTIKLGRFWVNECQYAHIILSIFGAQWWQVTRTNLSAGTCKHVHEIVDAMFPNQLLTRYCSVVPINISNNYKPASPIYI